eukprot:scaffold114148_cov48-Phaeocystis_antarctica.AAC.1
MSWRKNLPCFCMHANEPVLCLGPLRAVAAYNYRPGRNARNERAKGQYSPLGRILHATIGTPGHHPSLPALSPEIGSASS